MADREFVEQVMKRERRESPRKKVEKQAKPGGEMGMLCSRVDVFFSAAAFPLLTVGVKQ